MQVQAMAGRLSKFTIGDLALRSALELERARAGTSYDGEKLHALAAALRASAGGDSADQKVAHMLPGYFTPFERVYRSRVHDEPKSLDDIRKYLSTFIDEIDQTATLRPKRLDESLATRLVDFCLELNREFVQRQPSEERVGRARRSVPVEAFVR